MGRTSDVKARHAEGTIEASSVAFPVLGERGEMEVKEEHSSASEGPRV